MPRPEIIERVHKAHYDFRWGALQEKASLKAAYDLVLREAASHYAASVNDLRDAISKDFGAWMRENQLPPLPPPEKEKE